MTRGPYREARPTARAELGTALLVGALVSSCSGSRATADRDAVADAEPASDAAGDATGDAATDGSDAEDAGRLAPLEAFAGASSTPRLLWVGAHPDDEQNVAALFGAACVEERWQCAFLVATRGEGGSCVQPIGCPADLGAARVVEMQEAASVFDATLVQWDLGNGSGHLPYVGDVEDVFERWALRAGSVEALVDDLEAELHALAPTAVFTFDPRHGTTCHPEHRAIGSAVLAALRQMGDGAPVAFLFEGKFTAAHPFLGAGFVPYVPADGLVRAFDASAHLASIDGDAWQFFLGDRRAHWSQYDATSSYDLALAAATDRLRRVHLLARSDATPDDPRYADLCAR